MNKHTPGPWFWDEEVPTDYMTADWMNRAPWLLGENGQQVLDGQIVCKNLANVRLIAAAPELLEALKKAEAHLHALMAHIDTKPPKFQEYCWDKVLEARAAIAKAEGAQ